MKVNFKKDQNRSRGFTDPLMLIIFTATSQPFGQWALRYFLGEIKLLSCDDWNKIIQSLSLLAVGSFMVMIRYLRIRRK
jgi:hypothetical protein